MSHSRLLALILVGCLAALTARAAEPRSWMVDGVERTALVEPPSKKTASAPVVFVFHGHGGSSRNAARTFRLHEAWPEAWVIYPQGLPTPGLLSDKEGKRAGWQLRSGAQGDRDLAFYDAMLASLRAEPDVDARRVFAAGHSNGGGFAYLLWAERGDTLAALAPSAAALVLPERTLRPLPVLHLGGMRDRLVKFEWQERMIDLVLRVNRGGGRLASAPGEAVYPPKDDKGAETVVLLRAGGHRLADDAGERIAAFFRRAAPAAAAQEKRPAASAMAP